MKIKDYTEKDLKLKCLDLITKTFVELGQSKDDKTLVILAQSLYYDILQDFGNLTFEDIQQAFRNGVRHTDKFVLNVQTYYLWIKAHRQIIWNNSDKEPERQDKRLHYRNRKGTGIKNISNEIRRIKSS
tara:strand:- start:797 stop:1183 length:387 start_codon:yes stop_codon:yes gene_type:complete